MSDYRGGLRTHRQIDCVMQPLVATRRPSATPRHPAPLLPTEDLDRYSGDIDRWITGRVLPCGAHPLRAQAEADGSHPGSRCHRKGTGTHGELPDPFRVHRRKGHRTQPLCHRQREDLIPPPLRFCCPESLCRVDEILASALGALVRPKAHFGFSGVIARTKHHQLGLEDLRYSDQCIRIRL